MVEFVKIILAWFCQILGITGYYMKKTYRNRQVIRIINYHRTPDDELESFEEQLMYYQKHFENISYEKFCKFMNGELTLEKPGIILSFDDGLQNNHDNAAVLLKQFGFTGWYFVSAGLHDDEEYMSYENMKQLLRKGSVIGCHTYTHHRMDESDTEEILHHEIIDAKKDLERVLGNPVDVFCWCGGEENTYTAKAQEIIKNNYKWGFMTNSQLVTPECDHYLIQRTNVEARWPVVLMKFQISGIMDQLYTKKRNRIAERLK